MEPPSAVSCAQGPCARYATYDELEQATHAAEQTLRDGLDRENPMTRLKAAAYFLRLSKAGQRRGCGRCGSAHNEPVEPQSVTLKLIDEGRTWALGRYFRPLPSMRLLY
jgi:hypothetical protein